MELCIIFILSNINTSIVSNGSFKDKQTVLPYHLKKVLSSLKYAAYSSWLNVCRIRLGKSNYLLITFVWFTACLLPRVSAMLNRFLFHFSILK